MKLLLSLGLVFSFTVIADDHETPEYKYEVEANKAEYYIGNFNSNKDIDDLVAWYGKFAKWAEGKGDTYDESGPPSLTAVPKAGKFKPPGEGKLSPQS